MSPREIGLLLEKIGEMEWKLIEPPRRVAIGDEMKL
jgi:hypothetical protein